MPASKRRRAASRSATPRTVAAAEPAVVEVEVEAEAAPEPRATPVDALKRMRARLQPPPGTAGQRPVPTAADEQPWGRLALLVLLGLVLTFEVLLGLVTHFIYHPNRLIWIDLFFFNAVLALPAALVLAPLVKRLMHQHRHLRFLESLSLGAVYALVVTLMTLTFLRPTGLPANATADQLLDALRGADVPGIVVADLLAILVTVQIYPGLNRLVTAPGRRARKRLESRTGQKGSPRRGAAAPAARPAAKRGGASPRQRGPRADR